LITAKARQYVISREADKIKSNQASFIQSRDKKQTKKKQFNYFVLFV
jgi:hypothetical protein